MNDLSFSFYKFLSFERKDKSKDKNQICLII
jgi:hypothetical protein